MLPNVLGRRRSIVPRNPVMSLSEAETDVRPCPTFPSHVPCSPRHVSGTEMANVAPCHNVPVSLAAQDSVHERRCTGNTRQHVSVVCAERAGRTARGHPGSEAVSARSLPGTALLQGSRQAGCPSKYSSTPPSEPLSCRAPHQTQPGRTLTVVIPEVAKGATAVIAESVVAATSPAPCRVVFPRGQLTAAEARRAVVPLAPVVRVAFPCGAMKTLRRGWARVRTRCSRACSVCRPPGRPTDRVS